jgi:acetyltransferase-like isoleucine patch superfamily enzyme
LPLWNSSFWPVYLLNYMQVGRVVKDFFKKKKSWSDGYEVGRGTYGKPLVHSWGEPSTLKIGKFCSISGNVHILLGGNHRTDWITTYPFPVFWDNAKHTTDQSISKGDVSIGNDVWIGMGAMILSGVTIGNGAVIGASAVVSKDVPSYSIVAGNPAVVVKKRFPEEDISILEKIQWWDWDDPKIKASMHLLLDSQIEKLESFSNDYDQDRSR